MAVAVMGGLLLLFLIGQLFPKTENGILGCMMFFCHSTTSCLVC